MLFAILVTDFHKQPYMLPSTWVERAAVEARVAENNAEAKALGHTNVFQVVQLV